MIERRLKKRKYHVGGVYVYSRLNQILEQYPFVVKQTYKGRGAIICDTDQGLKILKEYSGSQARADFLHHMLLFLKESGQQGVDCVVKTKEDKTLATDIDETVYMVRDWHEGRECDARNKEDILQAVKQLASLHNVLQNYQAEIPEFLKVKPDALLLENEKHLRELKKVKNYISGKRKKNDFEMEFARHCDFFLEQASHIITLQKRELMEEESKENYGIYGICHGDFNHHNVIFLKGAPAIINYERALYDVQVGDFSKFMRKILEKHNWNHDLGKEMLEAYNKVRQMGKGEQSQLYIRLSYPEKFWKISNHYYNTSKAWVCGRDLEKLNKVVAQNQEKEQFLEMISSNLLF